MEKYVQSNISAVKVRKYPKTWKWGLLFISPWLIGFLAFQMYPLLSSLYYSFTDYSILADGTWVGLDNYIKLFTKDRHFLKSLTVTLKYTIIAVPLKLMFALFIAMLLNMKLRSINIFRTIYYLPSIMGGSVAVAILWKFLFMNEGIINQVLKAVGISGVNWLGDPDMALVTVSLLVVWQFGSSMVIFLGGLKGVPNELYEAASVDGASKITKFLKITVPMISPMIFFNLMMQTINALQEFTSVSVITNGGPNRGTYLLGLKIYEDAFTNKKMGYASATSWVLFVIVLIITALLFRSSQTWVHYGDGGEE